jgi:hypothetical protein
MSTILVRSADPDAPTTLAKAHTRIILDQDNAIAEHKKAVAALLRQP